MVSLGKTHDAVHTGPKSLTDPSRSKHGERYNERTPTTDVNEQLRAFVTAIKDCEQYRAFRKARERLDEDEDAQELLEASTARLRLMTSMRGRSVVR